MRSQIFEKDCYTIYQLLSASWWPILIFSSSFDRGHYSLTPIEEEQLIWIKDELSLHYNNEDHIVPAGANSSDITPKTTGPNTRPKGRFAYIIPRLRTYTFNVSHYPMQMAHVTSVYVDES